MGYGNYPSDVLPLPSANGYSFTVESVCRRKRMDSGRYRQYRVNTAQLHRVSLSWDLTDQELQLWKGFYNVVANQGSSFFTIGLAFGGGLKTNLAQFIGGYSVSASGQFDWRVSARLECDSIDEIDNQTDLETAGSPLGLVSTAWVDVFPKPSVGYSFQVESSTDRTGMSSGRYRSRKRFTRNVHMVDVEWFLTDSELEFWKGWHRVILEFGTLPFDIDLAFGDGYKTNSAKIAGGEFTATYAEGGNWRVSVQLECEAVVEDTTYSVYLSELAGRGSASMALPLHAVEIGSKVLVHSGGAALELENATLEDYT